ncbi:MAG TPA: hypothetical protein VIA18_31905 [Polyangia bacterium]|nr:hypothetical protein [Polyangia bacterium]
MAFCVGGCDVFDSQLYKNAMHAAADMAMSNPDGSMPIVDMAPADPDAAGVLCGRTTPATLCPGSYLFCDGFETETGSGFGNWDMPIVQGAGVGLNPGTGLIVADSPTCLGADSMHAKTVGGQQQAFVFETIPSRPSTLHVRIFFYMKQYSMTPFQVVGFHASMNKNTNDYATLNIDPANGTLSYAGGFFGQAVNFSGAQLPTNQWLCLELATTFNTQNGTVEVSLGDKQLGQSSGFATDPMSEQLDQVNVGIIYTNQGDTGTNDVYFDEVAISDQPIGCL